MRLEADPVAAVQGADPLDRDAGTVSTVTTRRLGFRPLSRNAAE